MYDSDYLVDVSDLIQRFYPQGNLSGLEHWSPLTAAQRAREEGIEELTEAHWHVIYVLRNHYREEGPARSARELIHLLERDFAAEGGRRYLYELFPKGPVSQGSRLAGVPPPPFSTDPSFGWAG
jgi:tRNA 2-thiouridine synthesizing protein E